MTAPEPTPTAEHIDAVARMMQPGAWKFSAAMSKERARIDARRLLTTTDADAIAALAANLPAAAMLDALVRAGALTEELGVLALRPDGERRLAAHFRTRGAAEAYCHLGAGLAVAHRHVTPWEVAP